jgi:hypothetical protein
MKRRFAVCLFHVGILIFYSLGYGSWANAQNEIMVDRCSGDVAFPLKYVDNGYPAPGLSPGQGVAPQAAVALTRGAWPQSGNGGSP